nr:GNAT family protein [Ktedonobacteraceae bacterium]
LSFDTGFLKHPTLLLSGRGSLMVFACWFPPSPDSLPHSQKSCLIVLSLEQAELLIERQRHRFEQKERFRWGIALKDSDTIIGTGGYVAWNHIWYNAELGYDLARPYWGQGIMTEAVRAMIQFGFEHMGLHRIEAEVMPENTASVRLLRKLDFQEEGVLHERSFWKGGFHDLAIFALLKRRSTS